jgi:hypothetical protein
MDIDFGTIFYLILILGSVIGSYIKNRRERKTVTQRNQTRQRDTRKDPRTASTAHRPVKHTSEDQSSELYWEVSPGVLVSIDPTENGWTSQQIEAARQHSLPAEIKPQPVETKITSLVQKNDVRNNLPVQSPQPLSFMVRLPRNPLKQMVVLSEILRPPLAERQNFDSKF